MQAQRAAAMTHAAVTMATVAFQCALAAGAPWGDYAMGGAFPGQLPPALRIAAIFQAVLLVLMTAIVLSRAGVALPRWSHASRRLVRIVVAFAAVSLVLNLVTPSAGERMLWAPVACLLLLTSSIVATSRT